MNELIVFLAETSKRLEAFKNEVNLSAALQADLTFIIYDVKRLKKALETKKKEE